MKIRRSTSLVLIALLMLSVACASAPIRKTAILNDELAKSVLRVQATVTEHYQQGGMNQPAYQAIQGVFKKMAIAGTALNVALGDANEQAALVQVRALLSFVDDLIQQHVIGLPATVKPYVLMAIESLRSVILPMLVALGGA